MEKMGKIIRFGLPVCSMWLLMCVNIQAQKLQENAVTTEEESTKGRIKVRKPTDLTPRIAGKSGGTLSAAECCTSQGIYVNTPDLKITGFSLTFLSARGEKEYSFTGNTFPDSVCRMLEKLPDEELIHLYNIQATDAQGKLFSLTPMRFEMAASDSKSASYSIYILDRTQNARVKIFLVLGPDESAWYFEGPDEAADLIKDIHTAYTSDFSYHGCSTLSRDKVLIRFFIPSLQFWFEGTHDPFGGFMLDKKNGEGTLRSKMRFIPYG